MADDHAAQERYLGLRARLHSTVRRMHYNLARVTDLDGLDRLATALERVALHGDRISVSTAQAEAARVRAAAAQAALRADAEAAPAMGGHGAGVSALPPTFGGPIQAPLGATPSEAEVYAMVGEPLVEPVLGPVPAVVEPVIGPVEDSAALAAPAPLSPPAAPLEPLVVKQKPPIARKGRTRGFVSKG